MELKEINIDLIDEPEYDVRDTILREGLEELANSIKQVGILKPIRVFERNGRYEIEDGHRRYLAAKMAELPTIPCLVIDSPEKERDLKKLHANLFSEELTPIELSRTLHHLIDEYGYTQEELARLMGKSQGRISQILSLTRLPEDIIEAMEDRKISEHVGRALGQITDDAKRKYYLQYAIDGGATIDTVRGWVAREKAAERAPEPPPEAPPIEVKPEEVPVPKGRCACCKKDFQLDHLMIMKFCGECYTDLRNIIPDLYKAMKMEREGKIQDLEPEPEPEEEPYP
ncbi:MAG: ParB/RepB/Spo0J family partition protein [Thaumarchaeota archaeon]|nr:ParB/RepB/Spo0J family partition protein [Nitrososphaerota archaeon]